MLGIFQSENAREGRASNSCHQEPVRHRKARYRGVANNIARLFTLFGFAKLVLAGRRFRSLKPQVHSERCEAAALLKSC